MLVTLSLPFCKPYFVTAPNKEEGKEVAIRLLPLALNVAGGCRQEGEIVRLRRFGWAGMHQATSAGSNGRDR